jgi:hypothetical protein
MVSYSGLVNGDTPATFSTSPNVAPTMTAPAGNHVGTYVGAIVASGASDPDYTISYAAGALTVTPAPLTITANNQSKAYGQANPPLTVSYSGFVNGDTAASLTTTPTITTTATTTSAVSASPYPINVGGAIDPDYTIVYRAGTLTITGVATTATATVVESVKRFGFHDQPTIFVLTFSTALDPVSADDVANYHLNRMCGHKLGHTIAIKTAIYDAAAHTVTLKPVHRVYLYRRYRLTVNGSTPAGVESPAGILLDGKGNGQPGSDLVTTFGREILAGRSVPISRIGTPTSRRR